MQRVGRINRVGTEFDRLYVFNFFPTAQSDEHLSLKERIIEKLQAFHDTLGEDFKYLSEAEQVTSHKLYDDLTADMGGEDGGNLELHYLAEIRRIRDDETELFERIKGLPRKAKSGKRSTLIGDCATVTFLRKGYLKMFIKTEGLETVGITFLEAIRLMQAAPDEERIEVGAGFFDQLASNKAAFDDRLNKDETAVFETATIVGNDAKAVRLLKSLSKCPKFTEQQLATLHRMIELWQNGDIPARKTKDILRLSKTTSDELQLFAWICERIPESYFEGRSQRREPETGIKEVILSCWLKNTGAH
jgi:hypothetical protein